MPTGIAIITSGGGAPESQIGRILVGHAADVIFRPEDFPNIVSGMAVSFELCVGSSREACVVEPASVLTSAAKGHIRDFAAKLGPDAASRIETESNFVKLRALSAVLSKAEGKVGIREVRKELR